MADTMKWISVKERLPDKELEDVLIFPNSFGEVSFGYCLKDGTWWSPVGEDPENMDPTHWMPLPAPPEE